MEGLTQEEEEEEGDRSRLGFEAVPKEKEEGRWAETDTIGLRRGRPSRSQWAEWRGSRSLYLDMGDFSFFFLNYLLVFITHMEFFFLFI